MRCQTHGLALGPNGLCVLCKRVSEPPPAGRAPRALVTGAAMAFAVLVGLAVVRHAAAWVQDRASASRAQAAAASSAGVHVTMYTTSWCSVCKRAKAWMDTKGYAYEEVDVEANQANYRAFKKINARGGVPTFDIDGEILPGFDGRAVEAAIAKAEQRRTSL